MGLTFSHRRLRRGIMQPDFRQLIQSFKFHKRRQRSFSFLMGRHFEVLINKELLLKNL
jgi:hypothetical protein